LTRTLALIRTSRHRRQFMKIGAGYGLCNANANANKLVMAAALDVDESKFYEINK